MCRASVLQDRQAATTILNIWSALLAVMLHHTCCRPARAAGARLASKLLLRAWAGASLVLRAVKLPCEGCGTHTLQKAMAERLNPGVAAPPAMQRMGGSGGAMPAEAGPAFGAARGMPEPGYSNSPLHMPAQVLPQIPNPITPAVVAPVVPACVRHQGARPSLIPSLPAVCACHLFSVGAGQCRGNLHISHLQRPCYMIPAEWRQLWRRRRRRVWGAPGPGPAQAPPPHPPPPPASRHRRHGTPL
jgi:hypothetical protein